MNLWQVMRQIKYRLQNLTWSDSPNESIFAAVKITAAYDPGIVDDLRKPFALVSPGVVQRDRENPIQQTSTVQITIYTRNENDKYGEGVLIGANNTTTRGASEGKGLLQIDQELIDSENILGQLNGISKYLIVRSGSTQSRVNNSMAEAVRTYTAEVGHYTQETYPDVHNVQTSLAAGDVTITWEDPPDRFDRLNIVVRRKAGSDPTGPADGTAVGTAAIGDEQIVDSSVPSAEQHYGVFAAYDKRYGTPTTATNYSPGKFDTITV